MNLHLSRKIPTYTILHKFINISFEFMSCFPAKLQCGCLTYYQVIIGPQKRNKNILLINKVVYTSYNNHGNKISIFRN